MKFGNYFLRILSSAQAALTVAIQYTVMGTKNASAINVTNSMYNKDTTSYEYFFSFSFINPNLTNFGLCLNLILSLRGKLQEETGKYPINPES